MSWNDGSQRYAGRETFSPWIGFESAFLENEIEREFENDFLWEVHNGGDRATAGPPSRIDVHTDGSGEIRSPGLIAPLADRRPSASFSGMSPSSPLCDLSTVALAKVNLSKPLNTECDESGKQKKSK
jgi:hypothetical protein